MHMEKQQAEPISYRPAEAAVAIGVSRRTIERWMKEGRVRATKVCGSVFIPAADIRSLVSGGR